MRDRYQAPGSVVYDRLDELADDKKYVCRLFCSECHTQVNESRVMTKAKLQQNWVLIVMGSGFSTPACPGCKTKTFSDLNISTDLCIFEAPAE